MWRINRQWSFETKSIVFILTRYAFTSEFVMEFNVHNLLVNCIECHKIIKATKVELMWTNSRQAQV